jgi:hypothetical protein
MRSGQHGRWIERLSVGCRRSRRTAQERQMPRMPRAPDRGGPDPRRVRKPLRRLCTQPRRERSMPSWPSCWVCDDKQRHPGLPGRAVGRPPRQECVVGTPPAGDHGADVAHLELSLVARFQPLHCPGVQPLSACGHRLVGPDARGSDEAVSDMLMSKITFPTASTCSRSQAWAGR